MAHEGSDRIRQPIGHWTICILISRVPDQARDLLVTG